MRVRHLAAAVVLAACGNDGTGPHSDQLEFIAGNHIVDTALAKPAQAIVIGVKDAGAGVQVVFEAVPSPLGGQYTSVASIVTSQFDATYADTTNARGQIAARVWLGSKAGDQYVRIKVPSRNVVDSIKLTIEPASLFNLSADPSNSTILLGADLTIHIGTSDAYGNARSGDPFTLRPLDATTTASGAVVHGAQFGAGTIEVSAGSQKGNIYVNVAPDVTFSGVGPQGVATVRSDGANLKVIIPMTFQTFSGPTHSSWVANGSAVAFDSYAILYWAKTDKTWSQLSNGTEAVNMPSVTADGQWIYYAKQTAGTWKIYRIKPDGTGDELVLDDPEPLTWPIPSPNGGYLAYVAGGHELRVRNLSTGSTRVMHQTATTPTWSPDGQQLAFICDDRVCLIGIDGSGLRAVGDPNRYNPGVEWSPDGRWLLAFNFAPELIDLTSSVVVPLTNSLSVGGLTWAR